MEALTIFGAVTGGISVASEILKALDKAIATASRVRDAPEQATTTLRGVSKMRQNMIRFQQLLDTQNTSRDGAGYITLTDAQNIFTDCVISLDELESLLRPLSDPDLHPLALVERFEWAMQDRRINLLTRRVHDAQASLGFMMTILQHEALMEIQRALSSLPELTERIGNNVAHLNRRIYSTSIVAPNRLDASDDDDTSTIHQIPATPLLKSIPVFEPFRRHRSAGLVTPVLEFESDHEPYPGQAPWPRYMSALAPLSTVPALLEQPSEPSPEEPGSGGTCAKWPHAKEPCDETAASAVPRFAFAFEETLKNSRPYRRAPNWSLEDVSFRSSNFNAHALSLLSKLTSLSLGDVSTISVIALPLFTADLFNSSHYFSTEESIDVGCSMQIAVHREESTASSNGASPPSRPITPRLSQPTNKEQLDKDEDVIQASVEGRRIELREARRKLPKPLH